jgi:hypothetical protein
MSWSGIDFHQLVVAPLALDLQRAVPAGFVHSVGEPAVANGASSERFAGRR